MFFRIVKEEKLILSLGYIHTLTFDSKAFILTEEIQDNKKFTYNSSAQNRKQSRLSTVL